MNVAYVAYLVILAFCTAASGFFSGSETAFIGISQERVHRLARTGRRGQRVEQLLADPERLLSTLLVANNLVNVLAAAVATTLFISLVGEQWGPWLATVAVTAVILVFGEITPKTVAARYPERFVLAVAPSIWQLSRVLAPVAHFFAAITRGLLRLLRIPIDRSSHLVTEEDIRALAELGHRGGEIEEAEREIIDALFDLADRPVREVMTPRLDMVTLTEPVSIDSVRDAVKATGHSRFPVTGEDQDDMRGILYVKDLFQQRHELEPEAIGALLRTPQYVPESATILATLQQMRRQRFAFGIVLDEHGGVEGLLTAKDLLAELVGELQDEYDPGIPTVVGIDERTWLADGRLSLEDLSEAIGLALPEGPYSTAAGLFMASSGKVPEEGEVVDLDRVRLVVLQMDRNRIDRMRVERRR
jgi:CBS domain containing-hemolysin-like protein